jgi:polar amino acid transport system substrate-binding protein
MPLMEIDNGEARRGILFDLHQRIAEQLQRPLQQRVVPRLRLRQLMDAGKVDVSCYVNPAWLAGSDRRYLWTVPFMTHRDLLVGHAPRPEPQLAHLKGERIGTVLGYSYPALEPLFRSGELRRDDGRRQEWVLAKLASRRYRYALSNELSLHWFNRQRPVASRLWAFDEIDSYPVSCVVRDDPAVPGRQVLRAMRQMQQAGEFETILARYR